jgi:hypothetical protein
MEFDEAIKEIEKNTCFRVTAITDKETAFFVPVAEDGETPIGPCLHFNRSKIMKLAAVGTPPTH